MPGVVTRTLQQILSLDSWERVHPEWPYFVSTDGKVWSEHSEKVLRTYSNEYGKYEKVDLRKHGKRWQEFVHRLVLCAHDRLPEEDEEAHHIDGDPSNNHIDNLEWVPVEKHATEENRETEGPLADEAPF